MTLLANDTTAAAGDVTPITKTVWRRLEEPFRLLTWEPPWPDWLSWSLLLGVVLAVAIFYVVWMYVKDSRGVGPWWGVVLGLLRVSVYALLAVVFLLPSRQTFLKTTSEAKVLVLFDMSDSMGVSDEQPPPPGSKQKMLTRRDKVLGFLNDSRANFLPELEKKNPVTVYRLGRRLDEQFLLFADGRNWTRAEREKPARDARGRVVVPEPAPLSETYWASFLSPAATFNVPDSLAAEDKARAEELAKKARDEQEGNLEAWDNSMVYLQGEHAKEAKDHPGRAVVVEVPASTSEAELRRLKRLLHTNTALVKDGVTKGTNLYDALRAALEREANNRVQGVIVFTDGRTTESSPQGLGDLKRLADTRKVPLFVVGVGEDRQRVKVEIAEVQAEPQIRPDDRFRVAVDVTGEGLLGQPVSVALEMTRVRKGKDGKEEELEIELAEEESKDSPKDFRPDTRQLGKKLILKPTLKEGEELKFGPGSPPRVTAEFILDAATLAAAAGVTLPESKKWGLAETKDSELKFVALVPVHPKERIAEKFHVSTPARVTVLKKPLRILLWASGANRDYQFVRTLMVRETEKKRAELAIHLQSPTGKPRMGVVQDVPPERLLTAFPETFDPKASAEAGDLYDLSSYDVIIAFDPDWSKVGAQQAKNLLAWAKQGGGLILVGGPMYTYQLAGTGDSDETKRLKPVKDLLPVVLADVRKFRDHNNRDYYARPNDAPWALNLDGATEEMEFLKLDESDGAKFKEDWKAFFYGAGAEESKTPVRGFFTVYPVAEAKPGSVVAARFPDPSLKLKKEDADMPYLVLTPDTSERCVWVGYAETWRLREYKDEFHERFWAKLVRYTGAKSLGKSAQRVKLQPSQTYKAHRDIELYAEVKTPLGEPLEKSKKVTLRLKAPAGAPDPKLDFTMAGVRDGLFMAKFQLATPGEYEAEARVVETNDTDPRKFTVLESNPELDNARPDFDAMYELASDYGAVELRLSDADKAELKRRLRTPPRAGTKSPGRDGGESKLKLYFDLTNAELIPRCMVSDPRTNESRGPVHDLWNEDFVDLGYRLRGEDPPSRDPKDKKFSVVLAGAVFLLSLEWLIRKLLRLA